MLIPEQRWHRAEDYMRRLNERLSHVEETDLRRRLQNPQNVDLFEDGAIQAVRALTDERRDRIAMVVANGIAGDDKERIEAKRVLQILAEIDDDQIIYLCSHMRRNQRDHSFLEQHRDLLVGPRLVLSSSADEADAHTLHQLGRQQLARHGLLKPTFNTPRKGELPEFDPSTGTMKARGDDITPLGRMVLRHLGLAAKGEF